MPSSQFTVYSSSDASGPGLLTGAAGTLLALLDACLVSGYVGKAAAGWSKPMANSGNLGAYTQGAGAGLSLVINDNGPNGTSTYKEAWAIGWESVAGIGAPVGTGSGQFPTPAQLLTTGHVVWRKSTTADATGRSWQLYADASTFYLFIATGDTAGMYYPAMFGDIFSLAGATDAYRCLIIGRTTENSTGGLPASALTPPAGPDMFDAMYVQRQYYSPVLAGCGGHFIARSWGGTGTSVNAGKVFDLSKASSGYPPSSSNWGFASMSGSVQVPNGPDYSLYLSPVTIVEPTSGAVRGRLRGIFQVCHPLAAFINGQPIAGGGDYAGKSLVMVLTLVNNGFCAVETSATVETN